MSDKVKIPNVQDLKQKLESLIQEIDTLMNYAPLGKIWHQQDPFWMADMIYRVECLHDALENGNPYDMDNL